MMNKKMSMLLSGLGYYRLSARRRKLLGIVFAGSLVVHVIGLAIFGSYKILVSLRDEKTVFVTPPPIKCYEPRKLEHRVKVQKRQRSSSRPSMVPRMVSMKVSNIALPEIKMDPKVVKTSFQPKFKAVSGRGLGVGLGTGYGLGGFGTGVSSFNFFGIKGRGDRIAVLVDVSVSMVEDERGGAEGFRRVKNRIFEVVDHLNEAALFNVMVFADAAQSFKGDMVIANDSNKSKAKQFLQGYNTEGNWGLTQGNLQSSSKGVRAEGGTTRLDLVLTAAFENGADTILIISDGLPRVLKGLDQAEVQAYEKMRERWFDTHRNTIAAWERSEAGAQFVEEKVWVPPQPAKPAIPPRPPKKTGLKEGQKPDRGFPGRPAQPARPGHWRMARRRVGGKARPRPEPPPPPKPRYWTLTDFIKHLTILHSDIYQKKGKRLPVIHVIGYQIDGEGGAFLKGISSAYKGKYRRVSRIR